MTETNQMDAMTEARNSFTGKNLTHSQFEESYAIAGILERKIRKSGSFRASLTAYSQALASDNKFDALKGETIIRDIFKARFGQTMNDMREGLMEREAIMTESGQDQALHYARSIEPMIAEGETMTAYRAIDEAAVAMAIQHSITEAGSIEMMKDAFAQAEGRDLYNFCKELEQEHHVPKRNAEYAARQARRKQSKSRAPARSTS